jgi:hypothetical protein
MTQKELSLQVEELYDYIVCPEPPADHDTKSLVDAIISWHDFVSQNDHSGGAYVK